MLLLQDLFYDPEPFSCYKILEIASFFKDIRYIYNRYFCFLEASHLFFCLDTEFHKKEQIFLSSSKLYPKYKCLVLYA